MNYISSRPDYLRFNHQIREDLQILASYKRNRFLKVTDHGFQRVSVVHAIFQAIKGKLGFTNYCSKALVHYHARKLHYEVNIVGTESFSDLLERIKINQDLTKRYKRIAVLFAHALPDLDKAKSDLIADYMQIKPCFWKRAFLTIPPFNAHEFGRASLDLPFEPRSATEGIRYFSDLLKMNLEEALLADFFKNSLDRYVKRQEIPSALKPNIAAMQMSIALAEFNRGLLDKAFETHQRIINDLEAETWAPQLVVRCLNNLIHCKDDRHFIELYRKAIITDFPREPFHAHLVNVAMGAQARNSLFELAFEEVGSQEITREFAEKWLDSTDASHEKLRNFFRLRQKALHSVSEIKAPWHLFKTAADVRSCEECCLTDEDRKDLEREYRARNNQEAHAQLESISFVDKLLFRRDRTKESEALERYRKTFAKAEGNEYNPSWLSPYLGLLSKSKKCHQELHQVVSKILIIARANKDGFKLLNIALPHIDLQMIISQGNSLAKYIERSHFKKAEKAALLDSLLEKGPHPYLYFLKGEYCSDEKKRLEAYRRAFTYSPHNSLDESEPYYEREILADGQVTIADIPLYRQCALEAGCQSV